MDDMNLIQLIEQFQDDKRCRAALESLRWPEGVKCPRCQSEKISRVVKREQFDCDSCRYQFSVTSGTMFQDSHIPLWKWFLAIYLMMESKKGMSANQLKRTLKVGYQTAWFLCHRIRAAMETDQSEKLKGTVEVDETYIGGRYDNRRKLGRYDKQIVMGMIERDGKFEAQTIPTPSSKVLVGIIRERVEREATVYTDELPAYKPVGFTRKHEKVNHTKKEWVRGDVHTNNIESAWSLFNRSIVGAYHKMSTKHMDSYLNEFEWRFNNRHNHFLFRDTLIRLLSSPKMEYRQLVKAS